MALVRPAEDAPAVECADGSGASGLKHIFSLVLGTQMASAQPVAGVHEALLPPTLCAFPNSNVYFAPPEGTPEDSEVTEQVETLLARVPLPDWQLNSSGSQPVSTTLSFDIHAAIRSGVIEPLKASHDFGMLPKEEIGKELHAPRSDATLLGAIDSFVTRPMENGSVVMCGPPTPQSTSSVSPTSCIKRIVLTVPTLPKEPAAALNAAIEQAVTSGSLDAITDNVLAQIVDAHVNGFAVCSDFGSLFFEHNTSLEAERDVVPGKTLRELYVCVCTSEAVALRHKGLGAVASRWSQAVVDSQNGGVSCANLLNIVTLRLQDVLIGADNSLNIDDVAAMAFATAIVAPLTVLRSGAARSGVPRAVIDMLCRMAQASTALRGHVIDTFCVSADGVACHGWTPTDAPCSAITYFLCVDAALQLCRGAWDGRALPAHIQQALERHAEGGDCIIPHVVPELCALAESPTWVSAVLLLRAMLLATVRLLVQRRDAPARGDGRVRLVEAMGRATRVVRIMEAGNLELSASNAAFIVCDAVSSTSLPWVFVAGKTLGGAASRALCSTSTECPETPYTAALGALLRASGASSERCVALLVQLSDAASGVFIRGRALRELARVLTGQRRDALLCSNERFVWTVLRYCDDASPHVREAALDCVSAVLEACLPAEDATQAEVAAVAVETLVRKIGDPSAGVSRRSVRLAFDILERHSTAVDDAQRAALRAALVVHADGGAHADAAYDALVSTWLMPAVTKLETLRASGEAAALQLHVFSATSDASRVIAWADARGCSSSLQSFVARTSSHGVSPSAFSASVLFSAIVDTLFEALVAGITGETTVLADQSMAAEGNVRSLLGALVTFFAASVDGSELDIHGAGLDAKRLAGHFRLLCGLVALDDSRAVLHALLLIRTALRRGDHMLFLTTPDLSSSLLRLAVRGSEDVVRCALEILCDIAASSPSVRSQLMSLRARLASFVSERLRHCMANSCAVSINTDATNTAVLAQNVQGDSRESYGTWGAPSMTEGQASSVSESVDDARKMALLIASQKNTLALSPGTAAAVARAIFSLGVLHREAVERKWILNDSDPNAPSVEEIVSLLAQCISIGGSEALHVFACMAAGEIVAAEPLRAVNDAVLSRDVLAAGLTSPVIAARLAVVRGFATVLALGKRSEDSAGFATSASARMDYAAALCAVFQLFAPRLCAVCEGGLLSNVLDCGPRGLLTNAGNDESNLDRVRDATQTLQLADAAGTLMLQMLRDGLAHPHTVVPALLALWCAVPDPCLLSAMYSPSFASLVARTHARLCAAGSEVIEAHDSFVAMSLPAAVQSLRAVLGPRALGSRVIAVEEAVCETVHRSVAHRLFDSVRSRVRRVDVLGALLRELHACIFSHSLAADIDGARFAAECIATLVFRSVEEVAHVLRRVGEMIALLENMDGLHADSDALHDSCVDGAIEKKTILTGRALSDALAGLVVLLRLSTHLTQSYRLSLVQAEAMAAASASSANAAHVGRRVSALQSPPSHEATDGTGVLGLDGDAMSVAEMRAEVALLAQGKLISRSSIARGNAARPSTRPSAPAKRSARGGARKTRAAAKRRRLHIEGVVSDETASSSDTDSDS